MNFNKNIRLLRNYKQKTQETVAGELGMSRSTLNSFENGTIRNPTVEALLAFSKYFRISIDTLLKVDLSGLSQFQLSDLLRGNDVYITGSKLRVLATTVDSHNKENIEAVPIKAKAGYKNGFADPEYIKKLPAFQLPILFNDRKYRMFQIEGDSMLPIEEKSWVIGEFAEDWYQIKNGTACILLTREEGIVFKIVMNELKRKKKLVLHSLNAQYAPYEIQATEIREIWKFCNYISSRLPEPVQQKDELKQMIERMENELREVKLKLSLT